MASSNIVPICNILRLSQRTRVGFPTYIFQQQKRHYDPVVRYEKMVKLRTEQQQREQKELEEQSLKGNTPSYHSYQNTSSTLRKDQH
jgi:hypothetical protein